MVAVIKTLAFLMAAAIINVGNRFNQTDSANTIDRLRARVLKLPKEVK